MEESHLAGSYGRVPNTSAMSPIPTDDFVSLYLLVPYIVSCTEQ